MQLSARDTEGHGGKSGGGAGAGVRQGGENALVPGFFLGGRKPLIICGIGFQNSQLVRQ